MVEQVKPMVTPERVNKNAAPLLYAQCVSFRACIAELERTGVIAQFPNAQLCKAELEAAIAAAEQEGCGMVPEGQWIHESDGLWRFRDPSGRQRIGMSKPQIAFSDDVWSWVVFSLEYDMEASAAGQLDIETTSGSHFVLETAKREAEIALLRLDGYLS